MPIPLLQLIAAICLLAFALLLGGAIFVWGMRLGASQWRAPKSSTPVRNSVPPFAPIAETQMPLAEIGAVTAAAEVPNDWNALPEKSAFPSTAIVGTSAAAAPPRREWRAYFGARGANDSKQVGAQLTWWSALSEWAIVMVGVWLFSTEYLTLGTRRPLSGPEAEIFQALDWVLVNNLKNFGEFPQWNPYILSGLPYVGDPFLHLFNPLVTLPVLWMGVWDGYKIGVFLSFIAAGISAWYLGKVMGVGRASRVWLALSYAFTGRAVAQFLQGQYDLIFSYAWIPLCVAGFIALAESKRPFHVALTALGLALLFLSGNVYYTFYMVFVFILFALVYSLKLRRSPLQVRLNKNVLGLLVAAGVLASAISAVQLLPFAQLWTQLDKQGDPALKSAHTLAQIWLDYTSTLPERDDTKYFAQETYSYIGYLPFLGLLLAPLAWLKQKRRVIVFMLLLFVLAVVWASARETPLRPLFESSAFLTQFRYPTRFLLYGALALLALSALVFDTLFQFLPARTLGGWRKLEWTAPRVAAGAAGVLVLALMFWSVTDVFTQNKPLAITYSPYEAAWETAAALRKFDASPNYVETPYSWVGALVSNRLRNLGMFYGYSLNRELQETFNRRPVPLRANYYVLAADQTPEMPDTQQVLEHEGLNIYRLTNNLPFAFVVSDEKLLDSGQGELRAQEVSEVKPQRATANVLQFQVETPDNATLVVLTPQFNGWRAQVDGDDAALRNIDGYLGVATRAGSHTYTFTFDSWLFKVGLAISIGGLLLTLYLLWADVFQWRVLFWDKFAETAVL